MANASGDTIITIGAKPYTLRADFAAIQHIETYFDNGIRNIVLKVAEEFRISHLAVITYYLLQANHRDDKDLDDFDKVGVMIMEYGVVDIISPLRKCIYNALNPNDPDQDDEGKDPAQRETKA